MNPCKQIKVVASGRRGNVDLTASNGNTGECTGEIGNCGCIHAEIRLLEKMPDPEVVLVSLSPCIDCAKALVAAGVRTVIYIEEYRSLEGRDFLVENDVDVVHGGHGRIVKGTTAAE